MTYLYLIYIEKDKINFERIDISNIHLILLFFLLKKVRSLFFNFEALFLILFPINFDVSACISRTINSCLT